MKRRYLNGSAEADHAEGMHVDSFAADCDTCRQQREFDPRERGDDDGIEYADPRDAREERR